jgi:hypothetical protein
MSTESTDLQEHVEGSNGIFVIRGSPIARSWNGIQYKIGMSAKNVPARQLSMNVAMVPPGAVLARARRLRGHAHILKVACDTNAATG